MDDLVSGTIEWPIASNGSCACRFVRRKDFGKIEQVERCGLHESQRAEMERLTAENAALRANNAEWIKANGPGGWVDALRVGAERYAFCKTLEGQVEFITVIRNRGAAHLDSAIDSARAKESGDG